MKPNLEIQSWNLILEPNSKPNLETQSWNLIKKSSYGSKPNNKTTPENGLQEEKYSFLNVKIK